MTRMDDDQLIALATLSAQVCDLDIPELARPGVLLNTRILMGHMNKVLGFEIPSGGIEDDGDTTTREPA